MRAWFGVRGSKTRLGRALEGSVLTKTGQSARGAPNAPRLELKRPGPRENCKEVVRSVWGGQARCGALLFQVGAADGPTKQPNEVRRE